VHNGNTSFISSKLQLMHAKEAQNVLASTLSATFHLGIRCSSRRIVFSHFHAISWNVFMQRWTICTRS